jgi:hypothetical protein
VLGPVVVVVAASSVVLGAQLVWVPFAWIVSEVDDHSQLPLLRQLRPNLGMESRAAET